MVDISNALIKKMQTENCTPFCAFLMLEKENGECYGHNCNRR